MLALAPTKLDSSSSAIDNPKLRGLCHTAWWMFPTVFQQENLPCQKTQLAISIVTDCIPQSPATLQPYALSLASVPPVVTATNSSRRPTSTPTKTPAPTPKRLGVS